MELPFVARYAEEEDASAIDRLILEAYQVEMVGNEFGCRRTAPVSLSQVLEDIESDTVRWLVIETEDASDSLPLAVVRMQVMGSTRSVLVDLMAVAEEVRGKGLGSWVLRRVERMAVELGMSALVVEILQYRHDIAAWLAKRHYTQIGGYLSEELRDPANNQPSTILQFQRILQNITSNENESSEASRSSASMNDVQALLAACISNTDLNGADEGNAPQSDLQEDIADLFAALNSADGEEVFQNLLEQQEHEGEK